MVDEDEFPILKEFDYHLYFKEQLSYFYFNLTRKQDVAVIDELYVQLKNVLKLLKTKIQESCSEWIDYLSLFYRMIAQTRDIYHGKGEHELSYMMILALYESYPNLSIYAIHRFVHPIDNICYGSWRDIKYFCQYVKDHSEKGEDHALIEVCIHLLNKQIHKDLESWKFSIHSFSREHLSLAAKWAPRENKKFDWLFRLLSIDWGKTHHPNILRTAIDYESILKAQMKCKRKYRKVVSLLNKALDTTEIKQCSQKWEEIDPAHVSYNTISRQKSLIYANDVLYKSNIINRIKCAYNFKKHFESKYDTKQEVVDTSKWSSFFPLSYYVKEAIRLLDIHRNTQQNVEYEMSILNKQWESLAKSICISKKAFIPLIDVSFSMQKKGSDSFYVGTALAILIASKSAMGKRIIALDHEPIWINFDADTTFISIIENIQTTILSQSNTLVNFDRGLDMILKSLLAMNNTTYFMQSLNIVLLSDFYKNDKIFKFGDIKKLFLNQNIVPPTFIYWNLSMDTCIPSMDIEKNIILLSGVSSGLVSKLFYVISKKSVDDHSYEHISKILKHPNYNLLGDYLQYLVSL